MEHDRYTYYINSSSKLDKPVLIPYRKYYEEIVEENRQEQRKIVAIEHEKSKKAMRKFTTKLKSTAHAHKQLISGPPWYQELSVNQINILNDLKNLIKSDFEDKSTDRVRRALKEIGVKTSIPHTVAKCAIASSQLSSVKFLKKIKDYLKDKIDKVLNRTGPVKYTLEERLVLSGIAHIGLPDLFVKLDYCLAAPSEVTDDKHDVGHTKKSSEKKYLSPYLEPVNVPDKCEQGKKRLAKIRRKNQELKEMIRFDEQLKEQKNEFCNNVKLKTQSSGPISPLNEMFENHKNGEIGEGETEEENEIGEEFEIEPAGLEDSSANNESTMDESENCDYTLKNKKVVINEKASFDEYKTKKSCIEDFPPNSSSAQSNNTVLSDFESNDWRNLNTNTENSLASSDDEESDLEDRIEGENLSFLTRDQEVDEYDEDFLWKEEQEKNNCENQSNLNSVNNSFAERSNAKNLSEIIEKSSMTKIMNNQTKIEGSLIRMFDNKINAFPDYRLHSLGVNVTEAYDSRIVNSTKSADKNVITNKIPRSIKSTSNEPIKPDSVETNNMPANVRAVKNKVSNQSTVEQPVTKTNETAHSLVPLDSLKKMLKKMHKLPQRKLFKKVLALLAKLGDPVAELPNIIQLEAILRWYEMRMNPKHGVTMENKAHLLNTSINLWKLSRPEIKHIPIPSNPISERRNHAKSTWNEKSMTMQKINETKDEYTRKIKEQLMNNTRTVYPTFKTMHYDDGLNRNFKETYHCYFPAKEDDIFLSDWQGN